MLVDQLIANSSFPNPTQLAFARKRNEKAERDAFYHVESVSPEFSLLLCVNLNGNVTSAVSRPNGYISNGCHETNDDWDPVNWADTGSLAVIKTGLTKDDILNDIEAGEVMRRYLDSITTEQDAICQGGYANWKLQIQLFVNMLAQRRSSAVEMSFIMSQTTCPGMEHSRPWMPPFAEASLIAADKVSPLVLREDEVSSLEEINEACRPRSSNLILNPPFMIRSQTREIFHSNNL